MLNRCSAAWLITAVSVLTAACASSGATPRPFPSPNHATAAPSSDGSTPSTQASPGPAAPGDADATLIGTALSLRGVPYRNGGSDPNGFDCSGFTQYVFAQHSITLPRETREQFEVGEKIKLGDVRTGDLVFFHTVARGASHVGIAVNDDEFVHAPSTAGVVRVEHLSSAYWSKRFIAARRVAPTELAATPLPFPGATRPSRSAD
jgi:cell wall-associated NlpC family hydrolase